jgi:predicted DNA-binding protein
MRKPKPINYDTELKIRISQKQKEILEKISSSYGLTMSQYIRELIEKDIYSD